MLPSSAPARADFHLLFIPLALVAGLLFGIASPLSIGVGGAAGSLLAGTAVLDGIALHPPTEN
ncbi:hypothetical protein JCM30237_29780 [Halolamina litorea]|uniref:Uncharacterized protein n=1 Tax=Halolamina litorea TaxID=1515593 RepID=A0ABD6BU50_9EURY|nr:hypothetical protein [Halolamina litorea]